MIEIKDLRYRYRKSNKDTINGISFNVKDGEIFGFLGPSGAGKSTTQKILTGLNRGYLGSVKIYGSELSKKDRSYYEDIGVSFEFPNLYTQFTGRENLEFFSSFYTKETEDINTLLDSVGLLEDANKKVANYSKGMKMRLNFARAFLNRPNLIFLDEPTSGLDPVNADLINGIVLKKKREGATVFITTHNMSVATKLCDRVAFIVDGDIKIVDSPKNLMYQYGKKEVVIEYFNGDHVKQEVYQLSELKGNKQFMDIINTREIKTIHTMDATLDDVFIKVTGRSLT